MPRFRHAVIVISAVLAACTSTEPDGLRLDIALDKTVVAVTDSVELSLTLTNASWRTVKVLPSTAYGLCMRAFQVFDAENREVAVPTGFCLLLAISIVPTPVELRPGQHIAIADWWRPGESTLNGQPLAPGTFRLRGRAEGDDRVIVSALRAVTLLESTIS